MSTNITVPVADSTGFPVRSSVVLTDAAVTMIVRALSGYLRELREAQGWSQPALADLCGWSGASVVCRLELSERELKIRRLVVMCAALGFRPSDVLRMAEDDALPAGSDLWTMHPRDVLYPGRGI